MWFEAYLPVLQLVSQFCGWSPSFGAGLSGQQPIYQFCSWSPSFAAGLTVLQLLLVALFCNLFPSLAAGFRVFSAGLSVLQFMAPCCSWFASFAAGLSVWQHSYIVPVLSATRRDAGGSDVLSLDNEKLRGEPPPPPPPPLPLPHALVRLWPDLSPRAIDWSIRSWDDTRIKGVWGRRRSTTRSL